MDRALYRPDGGEPRLGPFALLALSVGFGLWVLRTERIPVAYPNDSSVHSLTVAWATHQLRAGHFPLDGWFPFLSLGSPFFIHYQSISAVITGLLGELITPAQAVGWTLYLLLALWPISVYLGARFFGLNRWTAATAAAVAPLIMSSVGYGFEHQSYDWLGSGLWSQLWGMWMLPLAWGLSWRAVSQRRHVFWAVLALSSTIAFHFLTAYLAGLTLALWALLRPTQIVRRVGRVVVIGGGAVLAAAWVLVPLISTANFAATNEFEIGEFWDDSYGARKILRWLVTGHLYDNGRLPVFTVLVGIGFLVCVWRARRDERCRAVLGAYVLSMLLYFGRPTLGFAIDLLPDNQDLLLHRYVMGIDLAGCFLAAIGAIALANGALVLARRVAGGPLRRLAAVPHISIASSIIAIALLVGALIPAWTEVANYDYSSAIGIQEQLVADQNEGAQVNQLIDLAEADGGGRIYAGEPSNWGHSFTVGSVPVYIYLTDKGVDAIGFTLRTSSLMTDPEAYFDEYVPGDYRTFGIHYLLLPVGHPLPVPATLMQSVGAYELWRVGPPGLVHVVDTITPIVANSTNLGAQTQAFLSSAESTEGLYPTVAFDGKAAAPPTASSTAAPRTAAGTVRKESDDLTEGEVRATVDVRRTAVVLLSASFDPGWTVTVDGRAATPEIVAPALVGVTVSPGVHSVFFRYQAYPHYPLLFGLAALTLVGFALGPFAWRRLRSATRDIEDGKHGEDASADDERDPLP